MVALMARNMISVDFEVFGKVQGVFFRKHVFQRCKELDIKGWVRNTRTGTCIGTLQGQPDSVEQMKHWLMHEGSPNSRIATCEFSNERAIQDPEFEEFVIRHN